jgi:hypothetical protein
MNVEEMMLQGRGCMEYSGRRRMCHHGDLGSKDVDK